MGTSSCPSLKKSLIPWCSSGEEEGCPASASGSLEQQGAFSARGSGIVLCLYGERRLHFQEMGRLFQLAYEGFQAAEGRGGEVAVLSLGAGPGWGPGQVVGIPWESVQAVCSVQQLTVGGEKQVLANPTTTSPTPREGRRSKGGGRRGCDPALPLPSVAREQEDQGQCEPQASSSPAAFSVVCRLPGGSPLPPDPDGSSHVHAHTDTHAEKPRMHRRAHTHTSVSSGRSECVLPACLWVCFGYGLSSVRAGPGWGQMPSPRCPFS